MFDADRDDKVDRVVLTWSEPVTHARDVHKSYPFTIRGYTITSVGRRPQVPVAHPDGARARSA